MATRSKRLVSCVLALAIGWTTVSTAFAEDAIAKPTLVETQRTEDAHWAAATIRSWKDYGLINGYADGTFQPNRPIGRAEFIALLNRIFKFTEKPEAELADVPSQAWYREDLLKAIGAGIIQGDGDGKFRPLSPISRQEAAVVLAKAFRAKASDKQAYLKFKDADTISGWATEAISALLELKAITGLPSGHFAPASLLTRAEALTISDRLMGRLVNAAGVFSENIDGNLVVNTEDVTLRNMTINGNLYLAAGIGDGDVTLDGVTVKGTVYMEGGGENGIYLIRSILASLVVNKPDQRVRIISEDGSVIAVTHLYSGVKLDGTFESVIIQSEGLTVQILGGTIAQLLVTKNGASAKINLSPGVRIDRFIAEGKADVTGDGEVVEADIRADGVKFEKSPSRVLVADGVSFSGGTTVSESENEGNPGSGNGPGVPALQERVIHFAFGQTNDEQHANLIVQGNSGIDEIDTKVGELADTYTVRYLEEAESSISFEMDHPYPGREVTLELEEIHTRSDELLAYTVLVNGEEVYFRTYEEASEGPNHYFIEVPASVAGSAGKIEVELRNYGDARVHFGRLWAYSRFDRLLENEEIGRQMTVGLLQPVLKWDDYETDLQLVRDIKDEYAGMDMYKPALGFEILYMQWSEKELERRLEYLMRLSSDADIPIHLSINSWWGGTPSGPDGKGGRWTDIPYNQIVYDPLNIDGRGNWKLTTPNIWSNTPWLTMNNAHYNQVRADKVKGVASFISGKTAAMKASGSSLPPVVIFTENEPLYWPYFAFNASPEAGGDFGPDTIAAAAADGVALNPEDGLSQEEKLWMSGNLTTYIGTLSGAIAEGYGYNAIVVDQGQIIYPDSQLVENAYTHMFPTPNYPDWDEKRAHWETHMVNDIRFGAEWAGELDARYLDYIVARGKYADVNAERGSLTDMQTLKQAYMYGADYVNVYNYHAGDRQLIDDYDGQRAELVAVPAYDKPFGKYDFKAEDSLTVNAMLVGIEGVQREVLVEKYVATPDNGNVDGGRLTFRLDNDGDSFASGLTVKVEGRALSSLNADNRVEVWAGPEEGDLTLAATLKNFNSEVVEVSDHIDRDADVAYVELRLFSPGLPSSLYSWTSIWAFEAFLPWDKQTGHSDGTVYTVDQMRLRNLWISYRADVERLMNAYRIKSGENDTYQSITALYRAGKYRTAYDRLIRELSETLPAKYTVKGGGKLGKFPIEIDLGGSQRIADIVLYEADEETRFSLKAEVVRDATVTLSGLVNGQYYKAVSDDGGIYTVQTTTAGDSGAVLAVGGKAVFILTVFAESEKRYPESFEAAFVSKNKNLNKPTPKGYIYLESQDPEIGEYVNFVELKLADDAVIERGAAGAEDGELEEVPIEILNDGELLRITTNENNEAVHVRAYYGQIFGTVTDIRPISIRGVSSNAAIELDGLHEFEIGADAVLDSPKATGSGILTADLDDLGFEIGDQVTVTYSPYTYEGSPVRALKIAEVYDTLVAETFELADGDWMERAFSVDNVRTVPLDANYADKVVRPDHISEVGSIVWRINSGTPMSELAIEYSGRAIMGNPDPQSVKWSISDDLTEWTEVGGIEPGGEEGNFTLTRAIRLTDDVAGLTTVYVKVELRTASNDTWASLNDVKIKKKAELRELDSAVISLPDGTLFAGQSIPLTIEARYSNGDPVYLKDARIAYIIGDSDLAEASGGGLKLKQPGTTTVQAYVSIGGNVVKSNKLALEIASNKLSELEAVLDKNVIGANDTIAIAIKAYNDQAVEMNLQLLKIDMASSDVSVATVSDEGIVTGVTAGTTELTVRATQGETVIERKLALTVANVRTIYESRFDQVTSCSNESVCRTLEANETYKVPTDEVVVIADKAIYGNVEAAGGVFVPAIRGFYKGQGGPDNTWPIHEQATVIYKLDSAGDAFLSLKSEIAVRAGVFGSKISVYVGDSAENSNVFVGDLTGGTTQLDFTSFVQQKKTAYVKLVIAETAFDWGGIVSVTFNELTIDF
jgi:hypothetical protein